MLVAVVTLLTAAIGAQTAARDQARSTNTGSGTITGTIVVDDETRAPLRNATIWLSRTSVEDQRYTATDEQGRFSFGSLPTGTYWLSADKGAFLPMNYGAPKSGGMLGRTITLKEGETFAAPPIALMRGAVIAGRLLDRNGRPVADTNVSAFQIVMLNGARQIRTNVAEGNSGNSTTNAHGEYRMFGLMPGEYVVVADPGRREAPSAEVTPAELAWANQRSASVPTPAPGRPFLYAPTAFPGTTDFAAAAALVLSKGEQRLGVDFSLRYLPVSRVTGTVTAPDGRPAANVRYVLRPKQSSILSSLSGIQSAQQGSFAYAGVPPGDYTILVRGSSGAAPDPAGRGGAVPVAPVATLWGSAELSLAGQDVSGISIRLQSAMSVSGQVVVVPSSNSAPPPDLTRVRVQVAPFSGAGDFRNLVSGATPVAADGTFMIDGMLPGLFRVSVTAPASSGPGSPAWFPRSAMLAGKDLLDGPIEIVGNGDLSNIVVTLSDVQTEVSGTIVDGAGRPVPELYVIMFAKDRALLASSTRRVRSIRAGVDGSFRIAGLPPGEYYLGALTELDIMLVSEPSYLQQFIPTATTIIIAEGEKKTQNLRIGG